MYAVRFTQEAVEEAKALSKKVRNSLRKEIQKLAADPCGLSLELCEPLRGWRSYCWRNYRIIFRILESRKSIAIAAIGKRLPGSQADVYRKLEELARGGELAGQLLHLLRRAGP